MNNQIKKTNREKRQRYTRCFDYNMTVIIIFLVSFGLVMLYSVSSYTAMIEFDGNHMFYFWKQFRSVLIGFGAMALAIMIPHQIYAKYSPYFFGFAVFLCVLVQTPLGIEAGGARRWISMPIIGQFQPSELMKVAMILFVPFLICRLGKRINQWGNMFKVVGVGVIGFLCVYFLTENLSTAIIVLCIAIGIVLVVFKWGMHIILCGIPLVGILYYGLYRWAMSQPVGVTADDIGFRLMRIVALFRPDEYASDTAFQSLQSLYAIGAGGFWGKGLGNGTQKLSAIPEVQNDMILAAIIEELGIFGAILVMALFIMLLYRMLFIAKNAPDLYSSLIVVGIFVHIALQVILNIGVITSVLPNTGVTLPFFSYGGTAIMILLGEMGIALGVSLRIKILEEENV